MSSRPAELEQSAGSHSETEDSVRRSPIAALAAVAYAVILADLLTKLFVVAFVSGGSVTLLEHLRLALVFNDEGAFGLPASDFGIEVSTLLTFGLILLMLRVCRDLAAVDRRAPLMLGLIAGAGAANHMDMLASPRGVADFISIEIGSLEGIVFNIADLALLAGLVLCARMAVLLAMRILEERSSSLAFAGAGGEPRGTRSVNAAPWMPERARPMPLSREPEAVLAFLATSDARAAGEGESDGAVMRETTSAVDAGATSGAGDQPRRGSGWLGMPSRFDRAATPALVIACSFILLYSLAIVWLPDAGRSAPSALLLALGVFGTVFVAVYAEMVIAERRAARASADGVRVSAERERPLRRMPSADSVIGDQSVTRRVPERGDGDGDRSRVR